MTFYWLPVFHVCFQLLIVDLCIVIFVKQKKTLRIVMFFENYSIYTACNIPVNFVLKRLKFHKKLTKKWQNKPYCMLKIPTILKPT